MESKDYPIIQTSTAISMELEPPITVALEEAAMKIDTIADVMATAGIKPAASNFIMKGSTTVGSKQMKRRGRSRKWGLDEKMSFSTTISPKVLSQSINSFEQKQRERSHETRKLQISTLMGRLANKVGESFTPHVVMVYPGQDVVEKMMTLFEEGYHGFSILSANGVLCCATIRHHDYVDIMNYKGQYEILSLRGSYMWNANGRNGKLTLTLADPNGEKVFAGTIEGPIIAASPIQVVVGTFKPNVKSKFKRYLTQSPVALRKISAKSSFVPKSYAVESSTTVAARICGNEGLRRSKDSLLII